MKRIKRVVDTGFWSDEKVLDFSPEDKYFLLFLLTNEYTTQLGIYYLPIKKAAFDLGYSEDSVVTLLDRFEHKYGIIKYSQKTSEVAIKNYLVYSVVSGGKPVFDCLVKERDLVKDKSLLGYIYNSLNSKDIKNDTVINFINTLEIYKENKGINNNDNDNERHVDESCNESLTNRETDLSDEVLRLYRLHCPSLPEVRILSDKRKRSINALLKSFSIEEIIEGFKKAEASDFCKGKTGWRADFEFLVNKNNMVKVLEGKYDNRNQEQGFMDAIKNRVSSVDEW